MRGSGTGTVISDVLTSLVACFDLWTPHKEKANFVTDISVLIFFFSQNISAILTASLAEQRCEVLYCRQVCKEIVGKQVTTDRCLMSLIMSTFFSENCEEFILLPVLLL